MSQKIKYPKSIDELKNIILLQEPILFFSAQTSTVIPWNKIEEYFQSRNWSLPVFVSLQSLSKKMEWENGDPNTGILNIEGPVSWREADAFARSDRRRMMTMPTEDLASVLAGIATSCTGEHAFGLGTTRDQLVSVDFVNAEGIEQNLDSSDSIENILPQSFKIDTIVDYQKYYQEKYKNFKNAPFPRFEKATDLMVGSEGQLGAIIRSKIKTIKNDPVCHLFIKLQHTWYEDFTEHLALNQWGQEWRGEVLAFEFIDNLSLLMLPSNEQIIDPNFDYLFFEILESSIESITQDLLNKFPKINDTDLLIMEQNKFLHLRKSIPRAVAEKVSRLNIIKQGTDVQVGEELFAQLFLKYQEFKKSGIECLLFGHFGDRHLHFNFFPKNDLESKQVSQLLEDFYMELPKWGSVSPFAEHGIGFIKQKYIHPFYTTTVQKLKQELLKLLNENNVFFQMK